MDNKIFVNTQVPINIDDELRMIAAKLRVSRSQVVRIAIDEMLAKYRIIAVHGLPGPSDASPVPVVEVEPVEL